MLKKILFIVAVIVLLILGWTLWANLRESPPRSTFEIFQGDFLTSIAQQLTSGLPSSSTQNSAQVHIDELGEFSPVASMVTIVKDADSISVSDVSHEYIEIRADATNVQPINISGWSLQSMISDTWIGLPRGAESFVIGEINDVQDIYCVLAREPL